VKDNRVRVGPEALLVALLLITSCQASCQGRGTKKHNAEPTNDEQDFDGFGYPFLLRRSGSEYQMDCVAERQGTADCV